MCYTREGVLKDRREMLKVKIKSLAEEARIIRKEEERIAGILHDELSYHRRFPLRYETRATHLAYGLIRGRALERIEQPKTPRTDELWKKVKGMIEKYGPADKERRGEVLARCTG